MKTKIAHRYLYEGLGFPVELKNVELMFLHNEWQPKIDVRAVADSVIKELASQKERFTGHQIKFIRSYFSMTLREFAEKVVQESHTAVNKWEKHGAGPTNMDINIEKMLRLYIHEKTSVKTEQQKRDFHDKYLEIAGLF